MATEVLDTHEENSRHSRMEVTRLRFFLQGLSTCDALLYKDYYNVGAILTDAFEL
jgi:hypothetical protein